MQVISLFVEILSLSSEIKFFLYFFVNLFNSDSFKLISKFGNKLLNKFNKFSSLNCLFLIQNSFINNFKYLKLFSFFIVTKLLFISDLINSSLL